MIVEKKISTVSSLKSYFSLQINEFFVDRTGGRAVWCALKTVSRLNGKILSKQLWQNR